MSKIIRSSNVITVNDHSNTYRKADSIIDKSRQEAEDVIREAIEEKERLIEEAKVEADSIVENAKVDMKSKADALLEESKQLGYEEGLKSGYQEGYANGEAEGYQKAYEETLENRKSIIEEADGIKQDYLRTREEILNSLEPKIIEIIKSSAEKVINREIQDEDYMVNIILKGIDSLNDKDSLIIRASKEDYEKVVENKLEIMSRGSLIEDIDIKLDSNLEKGDCVIESAQGNVTTGINLQIDEMKKVLDDLLFEG